MRMAQSANSLLKKTRAHCISRPTNKPNQSRSKLSLSRWSGVWNLSRMIFCSRVTHLAICRCGTPNTELSSKLSIIWKLTSNVLLSTLNMALCTLLASTQEFCQFSLTQAHSSGCNLAFSGDNPTILGLSFWQGKMNCSPEAILLTSAFTRWRMALCLTNSVKTQYSTKNQQS